MVTDVGDAGSGQDFANPSEVERPANVGSPPIPETKPASARRRTSLILRILAILALTILVVVPATFGGIRLWALYHLRAGRDELGRYHHTSALAHLQACLKSRSDDPEALLLAARTQRRLGAYDEAERLLDHYQQTAGADNDLTLERVLMRADRGDTDSVVTFCHELIKRDSETAPLILEALTHGYMARFRWLEAQDCLNQWLKLRPDDTQALYYQGGMYAARDNQEQATASYRRALEIDGTRDEVRGRLAEVLLDLLRANEAQPHLEELHGAHAEDKQIAMNLARCYDQIGRQEDAARIADEVLASDPDYVPAVYERGLLAVRKGEWTTAETWLRRACQLQPSDFRARYQLSQCLERQGKEAEVRAMQPKLDQLEEDLRRVHDIVVMEMPFAPHDPALYLEIGSACLRMDNDADAMGWFNRALEEDPRHKPTHQALADYFEKHGNAVQAARHREMANPGGR